MKVPPKARKPGKPVNPVDALRGPLAYITGRPEFKEPVKKQSIKQLLIEAAVPPPPPPPPIIEERAPRSYRSKRTPSASAARSKSKYMSPIGDYEEADEEIIRPELRPDDSQSRRSASPAASRHHGGAPSVRSRRDPPRPSSVYDDTIEVDNHRSNRSRRHVSSGSIYNDTVQRHDHKHIRSRRHISSGSVYDDITEVDDHKYNRSRRYVSSGSVYDDEPYHRRSHRNSYHRERDQGGYYPSHHNYSTPHLAPAIQPIVIYSTPPANMGGCGGHHGCHGHGATYQHQCYAAPQPMLQPVSAIPALEAPKPTPAPSEISSRSSSSSKSRPMSYKWYTATQALDI